MNTQSILRTALLIIVLPAAPACSSSDDSAVPPPADAGVPPGGGTRAAIDLFWATYHGNDYARIPDVQAALQAAIDRDPNDAELYAYLAATHFWHIGEYKRDPHPDPAVLQQDMPMAAQLFQKASDLDPNEDHLPGFVGVTTVHAGQLANDPTLIALGDRILDRSVYRFPEFNNFNRWAAHNHDPKDSPSYRAALDSLWQLVDACVGASIDRSHPDLTPYVSLQISVGRKRVCWWGNDLAPYAWEGIMLNLGNGLVKAGQIDAARIAYANAKLPPDYDTWPYRAELEAIVASDLAARAALFADADPSNDPPITIKDRGCVYCHARVAER
ncbi:MAG TPA: hypothetical protein VKE22_16925 [Haliangiales bacterium]|nr:hypothetical protein [Haliangiales bacterium]